MQSQSQGKHEKVHQSSFQLLYSLLLFLWSTFLYTIIQYIFCISSVLLQLII